jgi:hypothetical protein
MVEVGDRVVVESEEVGTLTRGGVVMAVEGRLITVRWDSGSESVFIPSAGSWSHGPRATSWGGQRPLSQPEASEEIRDARGRLPRTWTEALGGGP